MRLNSSRLPRKALLALGRGTIADEVCVRLKKINADAFILATDETSFPELNLVAKRNYFDCVTGSATDVLARYCSVIRAVQAERIVRATGDNPLVSFELANLLLEHAAKTECDYAGFLGMPIGMGVEVVNTAALLRAEKEAVSAYDREHVCPYLYTHKNIFKVEQVPAPQEYCLTNVAKEFNSVTIDTAADYERVQKIYAALYRGPASIFSTLDVLEYLKKEAQ